MRHVDFQEVSARHFEGEWICERVLGSCLIVKTMKATLSILN